MGPCTYVCMLDICLCFMFICCDTVHERVAIIVSVLSKHSIISTYSLAQLYHTETQLKQYTQAYQEADARRNELVSPKTLVYRADRTSRHTALVT